MNTYNEGTLPDGWYQMRSLQGNMRGVVQIMTQDGETRVHSHSGSGSQRLADLLNDGFQFEYLVAIHPTLHEGLCAALVSLSTYVSRVGYLSEEDQDAASKGLLALASMLNVPEVIKAHEEEEQRRSSELLWSAELALSESQRFWSRAKLRQLAGEFAVAYRSAGGDYHTSSLMAWRDAAYAMGDAYELEIRRLKAEQEETPIETASRYVGAWTDTAIEQHAEAVIDDLPRYPQEVDRHRIHGRIVALAQEIRDDAANVFSALIIQTEQERDQARSALAIVQDTLSLEREQTNGEE